MSKKMGRMLDMTAGNPFKLLLRFATPLFLGNLLQQVYNVADTAIAGHMLGDAALAQIGATAALYSLITNLAFGMNNGLALPVSQAFGAKDPARLKQSVAWMTLLSGAFALVLTACSFFTRYPLLRALQPPQDGIQCGFRHLHAHGQILHDLIAIGVPPGQRRQYAGFQQSPLHLWVKHMSCPLSRYTIQHVVLCVKRVIKFFCKNARDLAPLPFRTAFDRAP